MSGTLTKIQDQSEQTDTISNLLKFYQKHLLVFSRVISVMQANMY